MGIGGGGGMKKPGGVAGMSGGGMGKMGDMSSGGGKMDMKLSQPMMMKLQQIKMDPTAMMRQALMSMMKPGK